MNAHRHPMRADADLSLPGSPRLVAELLDRLDLNGVTLVGNDTGCAPSNCSLAVAPPGSAASC
jgi:hypothetical protein